MSVNPKPAGRTDSQAAVSFVFPPLSLLLLSSLPSLRSSALLLVCCLFVACLLLLVAVCCCSLLLAAACSKCILLPLLVPQTPLFITTLALTLTLFLLDLHHVAPRYSLAFPPLLRIANARAPTPPSAAYGATDCTAYSIALTSV